jgi:hypothetical protein
VSLAGLLVIKMTINGVFMKKILMLFVLLISAVAFADEGRNQPEVVSASVDMAKKIITVRVSYAGGCEDHKISIEIGSCLESYPVQCTAKIFDKTSDRCEAYITRNVIFSLEDLGLSDNYYDGASISIQGGKKYDFEERKMISTSAHISLQTDLISSQMVAFPEAFISDSHAVKETSLVQVNNENKISASEVTLE